MKKLITFLVVVVLLGGVLVAGIYYFKGSDKHLQLIPKDAIVVGSVDFKSLARKIDIDKVQQFQFVKDLQETAGKDSGNADKKKWMDVVKNPLSSGINLMSDVYFFAAPQDDKSVFGLVLDIRDEEKFKATIQKLLPNDSIKEGKNYKVVYDQSGPSLAWNGTGLIVAFADEYGGHAIKQKFFDLAFNREKGQSITEAKYFREYEMTKKDISAYINLEQYMNVVGKYSNGMAQPYLATMNKMWKDGYAIVNTSFDDNAIKTSWSLKTDNKELEKMNYLNDKGISNNMLGMITTKDSYILMSYSLNMQKVLAFAQQIPSFKDMEETAAKGMGVETKDLETLLGGDIAFSLNDFDELQADKPDPAMIQQYQSMYGGQVPDYVLNPGPKFPRAVFSVNFSSNNKDAVKKLIAGKMMPRPDNIYVLSPMPDYTFYLAENKTGFTLTDDSALAKKVSLNQQGASLKKDVNDMAGGYPGAFYWNLDFNNYPLALRNYASHTAGPQYNAAMNFLKVFKDLRGSGNFHGGEFDLNLSDGKGNSLYRIMAQADELYKAEKSGRPL